jgi:hypothetical protein
MQWSINQTINHTFLTWLYTIREQRFNTENKNLQYHPVLRFWY